VSEHVVSPKVYAVILTALLVGTAVTVWAAKLDLGRLNIVLALAIATTKATLVILYFMHARYAPGRTQLVIIAGFFWLAIMLSLTLVDYRTRPAHESGLSTSQRFVPPAHFFRS